MLNPRVASAEKDSAQPVPINHEARISLLKKLQGQLTVKQYHGEQLKVLEKGGSG